MSHEGNGSRVYKVVYSSQILQKVQEILARAKQLGVLDSVHRSLKQIDMHLAKDPNSFGEPEYHLTQLRLLVATGAVAPLYVRFGLHQQLRIVFVQEIGWLPALQS